MLRVNPVNRQELLKRLTFHPKSLVFKTVSVPWQDFFVVICGKVAEKFGWYDYFRYFCSDFSIDYHELI